MEAASFALPVVNVGIRQQGRERARNVIDAPAEVSAIRAALDRALSSGIPQWSCRNDQSLRRRQLAAQIIASVLSSVPLDGLLIKQPAPLPHLPNRAQAERR